MKNILLITFLILSASCSSDSSKESDSQKGDLNQKDALMVYAFHGTRQCVTCKHMKIYTKSTLEKHFKEELKSGAIVYKVIDVDEEANYDLAEKFEATGTALMINIIKGGKDHIEDWSDFAFEFANSDQSKYEAELKEMIEEQLR